MSLTVGCHISIRNGFDRAAQTAIAIGCGAFQYFPKNPRSLTVKTFDTADAAKCADRSRIHHLNSFAHAPYPVNLATDDAQLATITQLSLLNDLSIAEAVGSLGVVVHFGKYAGKDPLQGYRNIIELLDSVLERWNGKAQLLIENQAAGMGSTLEELVQVRSLSKHSDRIGFCLDTCHAFASGLWDGRNWESLTERGQELDYWRHLKVVHLNDSRYPGGSGKDFHANIGRGYIGDGAFRSLLQSRILNAIPFILETPTSTEFPIQHEISHVKELAE